MSRINSKEDIIAELEKLATPETGVYIIRLDGKRLKKDNNKQSWSSIGAAKNALRCMFSHRQLRVWFKELEDEGRLTYEKI